jgi:hypothetical protein
MGRDHGAMEVEINRIDGPGGGEPLQQLAGDALIGLLRHRAGGRGGAPEQRAEFVALPLGGGDESRGRQIDPVEDSSIFRPRRRAGQPSAWAKS